MRAASGCAVVVLLVSGVLLPSALGQCSVGETDASQNVPPSRECPSGELFVHHDGGFENAFCWSFDGILPPYFGSFAEGYDLGSGTVSCGAYWLTCISYYYFNPADIYVWQGGVSGPPSAVLALVPDVSFENFWQWPQCGQNDVEIDACVLGEFAIGLWVDFSVEVCNYYVAADLDGPEGHPWTCIAPGQEWPSGWQDPSIVWGPVTSMGIGVYFDEGASPVQSATWGGIKALF